MLAKLNDSLNALVWGPPMMIQLVGVARGLFSNEAGLGSAPIAHGAAKTGEPVREGLVAMLGPFIDTLVFVAMIVVGACIQWDTIVGVSDTMNGLMAAPNLIALVALSPAVAAAAKDYWRRYRG